MKTNKIILPFMILFLISASLSAQTNSSFKRMKYTEGVNNITVGKLVESINIEELLEGFPKDEYEITGFHIGIVEAEKDPIEFAVDGNELNPGIKKIIKSLPAGTKLYVSYIKGKSKNGTDQNPRLFLPGGFVIN